MMADAQVVIFHTNSYVQVFTLFIYNFNKNSIYFDLYKNMHMHLSQEQTFLHCFSLFL